MHPIVHLATALVLLTGPVASAADLAANSSAPSTGPSPTAVGDWTPTHEFGMTVPAPDFLLPVPAPATVLTPFAPPGHRYGRGHRGVDLAAAVGTSVRAAGAGTVVYAGPLAGRGVVSIEHAGGLRTTYEPVAATVHAGQAVAAGAVIGTVQAGHASCAPASCLHFGARMPGRVYVDPMKLIGPWRVRLKPWTGQPLS